MKRRKFLIGLATIFLCLGVLCARAMWEGRSALQLGDTAYAANDSETAIRHWRRAARWYLPLAPHCAGAYQRLQEMGNAAQEKGDTQIALAAWTGIRSSVRATRSFYTPFAEELREADAHIAVLMADLEVAGDSSKDHSEREAWHYSLLQIDQMPSVFWSIIALLGLALWIGGGFAFALRGVDDNDRLVPKAAAYSAAGIVIGLLVWLTGLYLA